MRRLDDVLYNGTGRIDARLASLKRGVRTPLREHRCGEERAELGVRLKPTHVGHLAKLWLSNEPANLAARLAGKTRPACSDFDYPDQETGVKAPAWNPDGTANCTFKGEVTDGMGDGRALADDDGLQVAAAGSVVAPAFFGGEHQRGVRGGQRRAGSGTRGHLYRWSAKLPPFWRARCKPSSAIRCSSR